MICITSVETGQDKLYMHIIQFTGSSEKLGSGNLERCVVLQLVHLV